MSIIESLLSKEKQQEYREHYLARHHEEDKVCSFVSYFEGVLFPEQLQALIDGSWSFSLPQKIPLSTKRHYYKYPPDEALLMGYLNYVLLQAIDQMFPEVRPNVHALRLPPFVQQHLSAASTPGSVVLKGDIQNFSNTIRKEIFLEVQEKLLTDDPQALDLVKRIYESDYYFEGEEKKRSPFHLFMGTPLDSYSNATILFELDCVCYKRSLSYMRFNDDFFLVLESKEAASEILSDIQQICATLRLSLHPQKTKLIEPGESYDLFGLKITGNEVTLTQSVLDKMLKPYIPFFRQFVKMVRRGQIDGTTAMKQVITYIHHYRESSFFKQSIIPLLQCLTTDAELRRFDQMVVNWLRAIGVGTCSGAKYRISYKRIQALGYKSIVGLYYSHCR